MVTGMEDDDVDFGPEFGADTVLVVVQGSIHFEERSPGSRNNVSNVSEVVTIVAEYFAASSRAFGSFRSNRTEGAESVVGGVIFRKVPPSWLFSASLGENSLIFSDSGEDDDDDDSCDVGIDSYTT